MAKVNFPRGFKVYLPLCVLFLILVLILPRSGKFNYDYRKGSTWMYETLIAQFDFPILKTDEQIQREKERIGTSVIPYYQYVSEVELQKKRQAESLELASLDSLKTYLVSILSDIYGRGIVSESADDEVRDSQFQPENAVIIIQKDKRASKYPISEVYTVKSAQERILASLESIVPSVNADSLCLAGGIYDLIVPNLNYDAQTTELVHEESVNYVSPTSGVVNAGQLIVSHGEIITAEVEQLLDSYKVEYEASLGYDGPRFFLWSGNVMLVLIMVILLFFTIYFTNYRIFSEMNRYLYLLTIFALTATITFIAEKTNPEILYLIPFTLSALYLMAFFKKRVVLPVYMISLLPLLVFAHNGVELFVMYLTAGVVAIMSFSYFNKGWLQFVTASLVFLTSVLGYFTFEFINGIKGFNDYRNVLFLLLGSLLTVAGYPIIYLFERVFMLVSSTRLVELCDTNNKLLRILAHNAPGTFQHSLQVMNLADAAARSIDANVELIRAGAMYHDIGKTVNPQCFIENETLGAKYHAGLSPRESAKEIIRHVQDGMNLAEKHNLPDVVKEFIYTHHGTTCTAYFYNKYLNDGGDPDDAGDFYYKGRKPSTKEQIIIMLCDTLEAASRTLKDYSPASISELVDRILKTKMDDGQFEDADISIKELNIVCKVLKEYLQQVHHARVVYPKRNVR